MDTFHMYLQTALLSERVSVFEAVCDTYKGAGTKGNRPAPVCEERGGLEAQRPARWEWGGEL